MLRSPKQLLQKAQNAIEQRSGEQHHSGEVLQQSRLWARAITWGLIATAGCGIAWLAFAKTEEIVVAPGKLEPIGTVKEVRLPVGGVVNSVLVKDGQRVQKGQVLLRLDTEATADRQKSLLETIQLKQEQLRGKENELQRYLQLNTTEQQVLQKNLTLQQEILARLERLAREGASAELQYLQQRNEVQEVEGKLDQTRVDRLRQEAILAQAQQQLRSELSDLKSKLTELRVNIRYQAIRSPVDGLVFELKPTTPGFVAQSSEPVMKLVPFDKLEARVEIASSDIGFVSVGKPADVSIDSFPATDFGVLQGTVRSIGSDALPPDQLKQTYRFPANIKLNSQQLKLKSGQMLPLQVGMSLTANIKLRKVSYLQLLLSDFKDKADSLRRI